MVGGVVDGWVGGGGVVAGRWVGGWMDGVAGEGGVGGKRWGWWGQYYEGPKI